MTPGQTGESWAVALMVLGTVVALAIGVILALIVLERREWRRARQAMDGLRAEGVGWRRGPEGGMVPVVPVGAPLDQDDYAVILERDRARMAEAFRFSADRWVCRRCQGPAMLVGVHHPIWDGPFEGAGSGVVDRRDVPWCSRCDRLRDLGGVFGEGLAFGTALATAGRDAEVSGRPIRLPWLDTLPIRLRPELWERAAFHQLPLPVERFRPPPAGDAAAEEGPPAR